MNKKTFEEYMTEFNPDWKQILPFNIIKKAKYLYELKDCYQEINKVLISNSVHTDGKIARIKELCKVNGIIFQFVAKEKLSQYNEYNHQGVVAQVAPIKYTELEDFLAQSLRISKT